MIDKKLISFALQIKKNRSRQSFDRSKNKLRTKDPANQFEENQKKGTEFEKFVVRHFDDEYFTLINWRSDKSVGGISALMNQYPDLEFCFESKNQQMYFAVECKWRNQFDYNTIKLKEEQIAIYQYYEQITGYITFLMLGVGNEPGNPHELYIIPLSEISQPGLHEFSINVFRRQDPNKAFYLNCDLKTLR